MRRPQRRTKQTPRSSEIEVCLVDRCHLDARREMVENCEHLLRIFAITSRMTGNKDGLWTETGRHAERHSGMNTEFASRVRRRGYNATLVALTTDNNRFAAQRRVE